MESIFYQSISKLGTKHIEITVHNLTQKIIDFSNDGNNANRIKIILFCVIESK